MHNDHGEQEPTSYTQTDTQTHNTRAHTHAHTSTQTHTGAAAHLAVRDEVAVWKDRAGRDRGPLANHSAVHDDAARAHPRAVTHCARLKGARGACVRTQPQQKREAGRGRGRQGGAHRCTRCHRW